MDGCDGIGTVGAQIERLVQDSLKSSIVAAPLEPAGYYYFQNPAGEAALTLAKPGWHGERLASPTEMLTFVRRRIADKALKNPAIFYNENTIVLAYDADDRRDVAVCKLVASEQWATLVRIGGKHVAQDELVRLLRIVFRGCLSDNRLLALIREIKWAIDTGGGNSVQHGRESMGKQIVATVQGVDAIPEETSITIPVFDNHTFRAKIDVAIDINVRNQTFALIPFPQELHNAMESALDDILIQFSAEGLPPAFRGSYRAD